MEQTSAYRTPNLDVGFKNAIYITIYILIQNPRLHSTYG